MGTGALALATTADANTAIGRSALGANTTGQRSTVMGFNAGDACTTGSDNCIFGYEAGGAVTTGIENTMLGYYAGAATTTPDYNTFIGSGAGQANTTGAANTTIGAAAGDALTTGANNTIAGRDAGGVLNTGTNNLLLGHDSGLSGSPGGALTNDDNKIVLGDENIAEAHTQVDWTIASDKRDKTDVEPVKMGLEFINKLEPVTYRWDKRIKYVDKTDPTVDLNEVTTDGTHKEDWLDTGFLAQDVEDLESEYGYNISDKTNLTTTLSGDGKQYGLTYSKFTPMLVKAVQELSAKVEELETKLNNKE
jgi:hypothetical protein